MRAPFEKAGVQWADGQSLFVSGEEAQVGPDPWPVVERAPEWSQAREGRARAVGAGG